jgi:hypothetical protein
MVNVGIFDDHLEYFMTIWNILWPFGIIYGRLVLFVVICYIFPIWNVWTKTNLATPGRALIGVPSVGKGFLCGARRQKAFFISAEK